MSGATKYCNAPHDINSFFSRFARKSCTYVQHVWHSPTLVQKSLSFTLISNQTSKSAVTMVDASMDTDLIRLSILMNILKPTFR